MYMEKPSWVLTVVTQISLFFALYLALNLGQPYYRRNGIAGPFEIYFISVRGGGFRSLEQQSLLLKQIEMVVKTYDAKFVVNVGELGNGDPLLHNGTRRFPSLRVPWYTIEEDSKGKAAVYLLKQVELPIGKNLGIIALKTSLFQDSLSNARSDQMGQLMRMLEAADTHWSIVFGLQPLAACEEGNRDLEVNPNYQHLHHIFVKYRVNAYFSGKGCVNHAHKDGVAYISHPGPVENKPLSRNLTRSIGELEDGFLVHRVGLLEFETYFVTLNGNVTDEVVLHQSGAHVM
ncbi:hypothetical protein Dimus_023421 [Dionaea muscipula]